MTGWSVVVALYPRTLCSDTRKMKGTIPAHAEIFSQATAPEPLKYKPTHMEKVLKALIIFLDFVRPIYSISCIIDMFVEPMGAFYHLCT